MKIGFIILIMILCLVLWSVGIVTTEIFLQENVKENIIILIFDVIIYFLTLINLNYEIDNYKERKLLKSRKK
jgi:hypothetical protein